MKFTKITVAKLRNMACLQFHSEMIRLINREEAVKLRVSALLEDYVKSHRILSESVGKKAASPKTKSIVEGDKERTFRYSAVRDITYAALKHFDDKVREAAQRVSLIIKTSGVFSKLPMTERTAVVSRVVASLSQEYLVDSEILGLTEHVNKLAANNLRVKKLIDERMEWKNSKYSANTVAARNNLTEIYREIIHIIDSHITLEGIREFEPYVNIHNIVVARYKKMVAQSKKHYTSVRKSNCDGTSPKKKDEPKVAEIFLEENE